MRVRLFVRTVEQHFLEISDAAGLKGELGSFNFWGDGDWWVLTAYRFGLSETKETVLFFCKWGRVVFVWERFERTV